MSFESLKDDLKNPEDGRDSSNSGFYEFGAFRLDAVKRQLLREGAVVPLTPKALEVLLLLVTRHGRVVGKDELLRHVWPDTIVEENNLNVNVSLLRKTLGEKPNDHQFIVTVPGRGYQFVAKVRFAGSGEAKSPQVRSDKSSSAGNFLSSAETEPHAVKAIVSETLRFDGEGDGDVLVSIIEEERSPSDPFPEPESNVAQTPVSQPFGRSLQERGASPKPITNKTIFVVGPRILLAIALIATITIGLAAYFWPGESLPPMKVVPFTSFNGFETNPSFSPDGNFMAYCWTGEKNDNVDVYIQRIGSTGPPFRLTTDPADDIHPIWSPDGSQIAFSRVKSQTDKATYIVPALTGGPERQIYTSTVKSIWGGEKNMDWSPDGKVIAGPDKLSEDGPYVILLISTETLEHHQLTFPPANSFGDLGPQFSPDGRNLAFIRSSGSDLSTQDIYLVPAVGGEPKRLTLDNQQIRGFTWTADGSEIIFSSNRGGGSTTLWKVYVSGGQPEQVPIGELGASSPSIARKGNRLAFVKSSADINIYRLKLGSPERSTAVATQFVPSTQLEWNPKFSPDGKRIAFESERSGEHEIWLCNYDGSNLMRLTFSDTPSGSPRWSPDGQQIAFDSRQKGSSTADIYVISSQGGTPRRLTNVDEYDDNLPSWSKDGQWIYFTSKRNGNYQIWKVPALGGTPIQVTRGGGYLPYEASDGKSIYYAKSPGSQGIWQVPVEGGDEVPVLDSVKGYWGNWALTSEGIYYIEPETKNGVAIEFFSFATRKTTIVASLGKVNVSWNCLAVSPDRQWVLYTLVEHDGSDIMLVENFR